MCPYFTRVKQNVGKSNSGAEFGKQQILRNVGTEVPHSQQVQLPRPPIEELQGGFSQVGLQKDYICLCPLSMVASTSLFATTIAPILGAVLSNLMWGVPVLDIRAARKLRTLGAMNPVPYIVGMFCTCGWMLYGSLKHDGYLMWANLMAVPILVYCSFSIVGLSTADIVKLEDSIKDAESRGEKISSVESSIKTLAAKRSQLFYVETGLWMAFLTWGLLTWLSWVVWQNNNDLAIKIIGWSAMICNIAYFAAPLAMLSEVLRLRDSSSIFPPAVLANVCNCVMWLVYGYTAIQDPMVWVPNAIGLGLQVVNTALLLRYPRTTALAAQAVAAKDKGEGAGFYIGKSPMSSDNLLSEPLATA